MKSPGETPAAAAMAATVNASGPSIKAISAAARDNAVRVAAFFVSLSPDTYIFLQFLGASLM